MNWLSLFRPRAPRKPRTRQAPPRRHRGRPVLEVLEDRTAPAFFTVNTLLDPSIAGGVNTATGTINGLGATVSLRSAIQAANNTPGGNTILLSAGTYSIQL